MKNRKANEGREMKTYLALFFGKVGETEPVVYGGAEVRHKIGQRKRNTHRDTRTRPRPAPTVVHAHVVEVVDEQRTAVVVLKLLLRIAPRRAAVLRRHGGPVPLR